MVVVEHELTPLHQYCFSITNPEVVSRFITQVGIPDIFKIHRVVIASSLPARLVQPLELWLGNILESQAIEVDSLRLDFVSQTGLLNYALFADHRQQIINKLRHLDGFTSVDDVTNEKSS